MRATRRCPTSASAPKSTRWRSRCRRRRQRADHDERRHGDRARRRARRRHAGRVPKAKEAFRAELLNERRNQFFTAYMTKAKETHEDRGQQRRRAARDGRSSQTVSGRRSRHQDRGSEQFESPTSEVSDHARPHLTNANGISASGSPRRNSRDGAVSAAARAASLRPPAAPQHRSRDARPNCSVSAS